MTRPRNNLPRATHPTIAKWCIWSVENQSWLAGQMTIYIWIATAVVAFFTFLGVIALKTALWSVFVSGVIICISIWLLAQQRRIWLLNIQEPELRQRALAAMVNYLIAIKHVIPQQSQEHPLAESDPQKQAECNHTR